MPIEIPTSLVREVTTAIGVRRSVWLRLAIAPSVQHGPEYPWEVLQHEHVVPISELERSDVVRKIVVSKRCDDVARVDTFVDEMEGHAGSPEVSVQSLPELDEVSSVLRQKRVVAVHRTESSQVEDVLVEDLGAKDCDDPGPLRRQRVPASIPIQVVHA